MVRLTYIFLVSYLVLSSCKKVTGDCTKDIYAYEFYTNSKIDTIRTASSFFFLINPGNELVFSYTHTSPDCKSIADDEYLNKLVFRAPAGSTGFSYENNQLADAMCFFGEDGAWVSGAHKITSGKIIGTKRSDEKWDIQINIETGTSTGRLVINKTYSPH